MIQSLHKKIEGVQKRWAPYQKYQSAIFFMAGFLFDLITVGRIDNRFTLIQQAIYLVVISTILSWKLHPEVFQNYPKIQLKVELLLKTHEPIFHFLLGSLLSAFTIFYFKSSSGWVSALFMVLLAAVLVANELPKLQKSGLLLKSILFNLALSSFLIFLVPMLFNHLGIIVFVVSLLSALALNFIFAWILEKLKLEKRKIQKFILFPSVLVNSVFLILYLFQAIPPVPISIQYIGIFHSIQKENGQYLLSTEKPWWRFWHNGDEFFQSREGDKLFLFARIFSPSDFKDQTKINWYKNEKNGWVKWDSIPINIVGGRKNGFRGYAFKSNYVPGDWQVRLMTQDDREIGRLNFQVVADESKEKREFNIIRM